MKKILLLLICLLSNTYSYDINLYYSEPHLDPNLMQIMKQTFALENLVETGTYLGETSINGSKIFNRVYTVEISQTLFNQNRATFAGHPNIQPYCDESSTFLRKQSPFPKNTLFWLDAHYSGGITGTVYINDNWVKSPLKDELSTILDNFDSSYVILIDDVRGYLNVPDDWRFGREYPTINELYQLVKSRNPSLAFYILGDMALIYDTNQYNLTVSPFVEACTVSYLFNPFAPPDQLQIDQVMQAETFLREAPYSADSDRTLRNLYRFTVNAGDVSCFYHTLWNGLRSMQQKRYRFALKDFEKLLSFALGSSHDRINEYIAMCHRALNQTSKSSPRP